MRLEPLELFLSGRLFLVDEAEALSLALAWDKGLGATATPESVAG